MYCCNPDIAVNQSGLSNTFPLFFKMNFNFYYDSLRSIVNEFSLYGIILVLNVDNSVFTRLFGHNIYLINYLFNMPIQQQKVVIDIIGHNGILFT